MRPSRRLALQTRRWRSCICRLALMLLPTLRPWLKPVLRRQPQRQSCRPWTLEGSLANSSRSQQQPQRLHQLPVGLTRR
jgi:hypothetical protein